MRVCVRAHKRMYHNEKKVPDKIATTTSDASDTSRNQQQAQCKGKFNMSLRKRLVFIFFFSQSLPSLQKKREKQFTKPTHHGSTCFRTKIGVDSEDDSSS